ncbi:hypothetical protein IWX65_002997 [Arthrobacter sp. CAN_A214]
MSNPRAFLCLSFAFADATSVMSKFVVNRSSAGVGRNHCSISEFISA